MKIEEKTFIRWVNYKPRKIRFYLVPIRFNPWQLLYVVTKESNSDQNSKNISRKDAKLAKKC